jgi:hypothetical protein
MATTLTNVSFDGSPVVFRMDSPLLACFDPVALDVLRDLLLAAAPFDMAAILEQANANYPAMACYTIPDFRPGLFTLDPRDIKKFGDEDEDFDYGGEQAESDPDNTEPSYAFAAVDSGTLILADVARLPKLVTLLTWEEYDKALGGDGVFPRITEGLGGPYFAVIVSDSRLGMQFDGDGTYTVLVRSIQPVRGR